MSVQIRSLAAGEETFLREMFYASLSVPPGQPPFPPEFLEKPDLKKYYQHWGSGREDIALVAIRKEQLMGAAWGRVFGARNPGLGFVDESIPEIGLAIKAEWRGQGIGTVLLEALQSTYCSRGFRQLSLSTNEWSPACKLYQRLGFRVVKQTDTSLTMLWEANPSRRD